MNIYAIPGLGADERVFQYLIVTPKIVVLKWIEFGKNETLKSYAQRMVKQIDQTQPFALLGVSFGAMLAVEMSLITRPVCTVLISSVEVASELPKTYKWVGRTQLIPNLPLFLFKPPKWLITWLFGATNRKLLAAILDDTEPKLVRWALQKITTWKNTKRLANCLKINGRNDKLFPPANHSDQVIIDGGHHFMIVDKAASVSDAINHFWSNYVDV